MSLLLFQIALWLKMSKLKAIWDPLEENWVTNLRHATKIKIIVSDCKTIYVVSNSIRITICNLRMLANFILISQERLEKSNNAITFWQFS